MVVRPSPLRAALLVLAAGACVTPQPTSTTPRPVADDVRAARLALGPVDDVLLPADDPRPRLRALRDLADRLDNDNEATQAAMAVVNLSKQRVQLTDAAGKAVAQKELASDLDAAIAIIERRKEWWALPNLVDAEPDTAKRGAILLRALDGGLEYLSNESLELARASARTPRQKALLERADRLGLPPLLDRAALAALGVEFLDVLEARMFDEADRGELAAAVASANAVVALDPMHVEARLMLAYDADRRAGRLEHRTRVLRALLLIGDDNEESVGPQAVAMLEYARHDAPLAGSLVVGEAIALIAAGVPGDAWSLLERTPVTGVGELRDDVRGLLALEAGALATYRVWREARGGRTSPSVAMRELRFLWREDAPAQQTIAEEAARRAVDAGWPTLRHSWSWGLAETVAKDDKAPRALRERALERVSAGEHAVLRHCIDTSSPAVSCQRLLDAVFTVTDDEGGEISMPEAVAALAGVPGTANLWLPNLVWADADTLATVDGYVITLEGSAPAMTEIWVSVAVRAAIARGDTTEAARLLGAYGSLLTPLGLAASRLAIADVRADVAPHDVADALAQIAWLRWPIFQVPDQKEKEPEDEDEDEVEDEDGGEGEVHALTTALDLTQREPEEMAATVAAIRARHPEPELAALDIIVAVALAAQDVPAPSTVVLPAGIPEHDLIALLRDRNDAGTSRPSLAHYLQRRVANEWLKQRLDPSARDGTRTNDEIAARRSTIDDAAPSEIRARAAEVLAVARKDEYPDDKELAWLALLAGDVADARALASARNRLRPSEPALPPDHPVHRLLDERAALPDELVRKLWQLYTHPDGAEGAGIALELLEHPAAGPQSAALACRLFVDSQQPEAAIAPCWKAWRGGVHDVDIGVAVTWLLTSVSEAAAAHGIDGDELAVEATLRLADEDEGAVWVNLGYWFQEDKGDAERANAFAEAADRAGWHWDDLKVSYDMLDGSRAPFLRAWTGAQARQRGIDHVERARMALAAGDPAAARWYFAASKSITAVTDDATDNRAIEETLADIADLATRDIADRALTEADVGQWFRAFVYDQRLPAAFLARHANSALVSTTIAGLAQHPNRVGAAERLIARVPENRFAIVRAASALAMNGKRADAEKALARVRTQYPDSALVAAAILGGDRTDEAWLESPAAFDQALDAVTPAQLTALDPMRVAYGAAELFVPRKKVGDLNVFDLELGGRIAILETPNPTRCKGNDCLDSELRGYGSDWKPRWRREIAMAGTTAGQVLIDGPPGTMVLTLVPSGGRLFQLVALVPPTKGDAMRPAIRLAHDTLRALDLVVPADRAEALRTGATLPADGIRLAARRGVTSSGCGWIPRGLETYERSALLLDVALLDPSFLPRATTCADDTYPSGALAALAILSEDPAAYAFGKRVADDASYMVLTAAQTLLAPGQAQTSLDLTIGAERPRRAWLTLASALPEPSRQHAVDKLLESHEPADRAAGILVAGLVPTDETRRRLRDELALAPAGFAQLAIEAMPRPLGPAELAVLRRRADRAPATLDATEKRLTGALMRALRDAGDPADKDRIARLAKRLDEKVPEPVAPAVAGGAPLTDDELRTLALPQMLDRGKWAYARAPQPGAFFAAMRDLLGRLKVDAVADQYVLRTMIEAASGGLSILGTNGGLDLRHPIECASRGFGDDYVCTATLADAAALEKTLTAWPESLSTIRAPQVGAFVGGPMSLFAGGTPLLVERVFDEPDPDDDDDDFFGNRGGRRILHERARLVSTIAGRQVVRHLVVSANDDGRSELEGASLVIVGDRLFVFSDLAMAQSVLAGKPAAGAALADDPAFQAEVAGWVDGVAIQGIELDGKEQTAVALVPEADGIRFRVRHIDERPTPPTRAIGLLPPGAKATLAAGRGPGDSVGNAGMEKLMGDREWLLEHDGELAFGWYPPAAGASDGWVVAMRSNRSLERNLAKHGFAKLGNTLRAKDGLHAVRHGDYVVIGSRADLVRSATSRKPGGDDRNWVSALDGHALADAVRARPVKDSERAAIVRVVALFVDLVGNVEASNRRVGKVDVLEGTIRPPLRRAEDTSDVIDRWLATPELRNTTRLPRALSETEVERPLAFVIEMADAKDAAQRLFPATPRTTVTAIDDTHVRVVVTPAPPLGDTVAATPIDAPTRRRTLADDKDVRTSHARIQKLARELVPTPNRTTASDTAVRVGRWVHEHIRYEVTPAGGDAVDILERGSGDCTEYSLLTVSLLRASGVPAEIRSGVAAGGGELVAHAWVAFHDGTAWREIDPTWGRTSVGADHIETSILDFVALVSLDRLVIKAVEVAPVSLVPSSPF